MSEAPHSRAPLKVLLLENIHPLAVELFKSRGCQVELLSKALGEDELKQKLTGVDILGIRSKTQITKEVLAEAKSLIAIGCFCIGTNQVDLREAKLRGIPVFNAPFGNTRSVAEMVIAEIIGLARQLFQRSSEVHRGVWRKVSSQCFEVRGKTLGIIGYGNIGSQVSTLAEALGMRVLFFDIVTKLPLGNARNCNTLEDLLRQSDFVTLHVPATTLTENMIAEAQIKIMKKGAALVNASRGTVVDIAALAAALQRGDLSGAAVDVFPEEPESNSETFKTQLQGLSNVILTPHIGGATEEAQANIGAEVPASLLRFALSGSSNGAVNFPQIDLTPTKGSHRILNVHRNVPGVLREINRIISDLGANIDAQALATDADIGFLVLDTDRQLSQEINAKIAALKTSIATRVLY